jgi:hypothetical protein
MNGWHEVGGIVARLFAGLMTPDLTPAPTDCGTQSRTLADDAAGSTVQ